jgi:diguanylate cyclase
LRILGMGLGGMVVGVVLWERQALAVEWAVLLFTSLVWPHVAYLLTRRSADPYRAEAHNLLIDSGLIAALVPLMHFNLLPSALILTLTMVDKITTGIRGLWARSIPVMLLAGLASTALTGFHVAPDTSMRVITACLPVMVLHTLSVSLVSYQLIRTTARQNHLLDELRRLDALTGLYGRGHWQEQAEAALRRHLATGEPACMLLVDVDHFKQINDVHGHTVGDEVLRVLARVVRSTVRVGDCAGRYGGDEFAIILPGARTSDAVAIAERIRAHSESLRLRHLPALRLSCSLGVAPAQAHHASVRAWIDSADGALYQAKKAGRNRVGEAATAAAAPAPADAKVPPCAEPQTAPDVAQQGAQ